MQLKKIKNTKKIYLIFDDGLQDKSIEYDLSIVCFNSINWDRKWKTFACRSIKRKFK